MDFFNALTLDLKMLVVGIAGCALLALFSSNRGAEKRYTIVLVVLTAVGVYRFTHVAHDLAGASVAAGPAQHFVRAQTQHTPLASTSAK